MKNYTLDEIVRRSIKRHGLTMHYYMDFLGIAMDGIKKINLETLPHLKSSKLTVKDDFTVDLPRDAIDVLVVGTEVGDKVRPMGKNNSLNDRDNNDEAFGQPELESYESFQTSFYNDHFNKSGNFLGKLFGQGVQWTDEYTVIRAEGIIRLNQKTSATHVYVSYVSEPETKSGKTLVHPYAEESLRNYIAWQYELYRTKNRFAIITKKKDFFNSYRVLRSKRFNLSTTDLKRAFRKNYKMSPKN